MMGKHERLGRLGKVFFLVLLQALCCFFFFAGCLEEEEEEKCADHDECDDGVFCNGVEQCGPDSPMASSFGCVPGIPCEGFCIESTDACIGGSMCTADEDCDDGLFCSGEEFCSPGAALAGPQGCIAATTGVCEEGSTCDEDQDECIVDCPGGRDRDGDGHEAVECGGDDCDDDDGSRYPGNIEACDADDRDEDCDTLTFGERDHDGDGYVSDACCNVDADLEFVCGTDCDDDDPAIHSGQIEVCNGVDDNCNDEVDEGAQVLAYPDNDGDGFGEMVMEAELVCPDTPGYTFQPGDCDDENPQIIPGSIVCTDTQMISEYHICLPTGLWAEGACTDWWVCVTQPGGHGVCAYY